MTNTVDNFDIADKIIELLTINHDKFYTIRQIHSELYDKYEEFKRIDLKKDLINKLKVTFMTIEGEYSNIYRIVKKDPQNQNDIHYLIWSLKTKEEIIADLKKNTSNDSTTESIKDQFSDDLEKDLDKFATFTTQTDYVSIIKKMSDEMNFAFMYDKNFMDGVNNPIHILIKNNELELIKKLHELTVIDYEVCNKEGKTCIDLAQDTNNCDLLKFIMEETYSVRSDKLIKLIGTLKDAQKEAYDKVISLNGNVVNLQKRIDDLKSESFIETLKTILIVVLFSYCVSR